MTIPKSAQIGNVLRPFHSGQTLSHGTPPCARGVLHHVLVSLPELDGFGSLQSLSKVLLFERFVVVQLLRITRRIEAATWPRSCTFSRE